MADDAQSSPPNSNFSGINPGELFALAMNAQPSGGARGWQPPSVEELQQALPQYEIVALAGRGAMGAVYKAWQKSLDRHVAIKILPPEFTGSDADFASRFKREAKATARLSHPGIVAVHDAGETPGGLLYFIMDFVEGSDIHQLLKAQGRLPPDEALTITARICEALAYAHGKGIIHRDIKPSNVLVDAEGNVKVADFGLARISNADASLLTASDMAVGTPDFMAPESQLGSAHVDHRADLYAVGVMLYQMLTGKLPRGRFDPPSRAVPGLDRRLDAIVDRALQNDRDARYSSALELRSAVEPVLAQTIARRKTGALSAPRSRKTIQLLLAAFGLILAAGAIYWVRARVPLPSSGTLAGTGWTIAGSAPDRAPWRDALAQSPLKEVIASAERTAQGWLLPPGNHWRFPPAPLGPSALRWRGVVRAGWPAFLVSTSDEHFYVLDVNPQNRRPGLTERIGSGSKLLAEGKALADSMPRPGEVSEVTLVRTGGRLFMSINGQEAVVAPDPAPGSARFGLVTRSDLEFATLSLAYIDLTGLSEPEALQLVEGGSRSPQRDQKKVSAVPPVLPSPSGPGDPPAPVLLSGRWVTVVATLPDLPADIRSKFTMDASGTWIIPNNSALGILLPHAAIRDGGLRAVFQRQPPKLSMLHVRRRGKPENREVYLFGFANSRVTAQIAHYRAERFSDGNNTRSILSRNLAAIPEGSEYTLEFIAIGSTLIGRINGQTVARERDTALAEGGMTLLASEPFRNLQVINLDGLSEPEALQLVEGGSRSPQRDEKKVSALPPVLPSPSGQGDPPAATGAGAPYPQVDAGGKVTYPVGVWTRLWTAGEEAAKVERRDGEWLLLKSNSHGRMTGPGLTLPLTNVGLRARFRGQRVKEDDFPQINLRSGGRTSLNLYIVPGGDKLQIRRAHADGGLAALAEASLRAKLRPAPREYAVEFYAIGSRLIGRIDGQTLTAELPEATASGGVDLLSADADYLRDVEVLNLDGLPEAEARKVIGVEKP